MFERLGNRLTSSVLIWDIILTLLCLRGASSIRLQLEFGKDLNLYQVQLPWQIYLAVGFIWAIIFLLFTPQRALFLSSFIDATGRLVAAVALANLSFAGLLYLSFRDVSRLQFIYFAIGNFIALLLFHVLIRSYTHFRQRQGWQRRILIVGGGQMTQQLAREFLRRPWTGVNIVGYASDRVEDSKDLEHLGAITETPQLVTRHQIDEVIFTLPPNQQDRTANISLQLQQFPVMLHMIPSVLDLTFARTPVNDLGGIPLISLRDSALTEAQRLLKRIFDIVASALLIIIFLPLMCVIALLIKLESPGPVFFMQKRLGEHSVPFKMIKFRSMYRDAERRWQEVAQRDTDGHLLHKSSDDPRITHVGRKLRRTSLDELPQLFNVLLGDMSLVGPRPEMPYIAAEYEPWQWQRFRVPPGMTGWWQVNGRSEKPMHLNTEDDLYYIQNYSFWLDLRILFKTIFVVLNRHGAY